jgi:hypothetical protein
LVPDRYPAPSSHFLWTVPLNAAPRTYQGSWIPKEIGRSMDSRNTGRLTRTAATLAALSSLALAMTLLVTPALGVTYAVVDGHEPHSDEANHASFWEARYPGADCDKPSELSNLGKGYVLPALGTGDAYVAVIVKTGSGTFANTIFESPAAGETVWADTNGNNAFDADDKDSISHIIICLGDAAGTPAGTPNGTPAGTPQSTPDGDDDASLNIRKEDEEGHRLPGAVFTIQGMQGTFTSDEFGQVCIHGLPEDSVWLVTEIQAPAGYDIANPASQMVEVDNDGDCDSPDARFVNTVSTGTPGQTPEGSVAGSTGTPEGSVAGSTGTPAPSQPDTALLGQNGPSAIPTIAFAVILVAALGTLAWANVKSARSRA